MLGKPRLRCRTASRVRKRWWPAVIRRGCWGGAVARRPVGLLDGTLPGELNTHETEPAQDVQDVRPTRRGAL